MRKSLILTTTLVSSLFLSGCAFNTVSNTTIKKETKTNVAPPMPIAPKKIKKIVNDTGVPQYGPNIYKTVSSAPCGGNGCSRTKYDVTQDGITDYPVSYRPKRETIVKDTVLIEE